jgi:hypothetical protein
MVTRRLPLAVYPTPTTPSPLDFNGSSCQRLISRDFSQNEVVSLIEAIFTNQGEVKMIGYLPKRDAQTFIDVIDEVRLYTPSPPGPGLITLVLFTSYGDHHSLYQAIDRPDILPRLRKKCLNALCKLCGRQALLPRSLKMSLCYDRSGAPLYQGGYADVWKGEHQGRPIAVKVLRVYAMSNFEKITSVGSQSLPQRLAS